MIAIEVAAAETVVPLRRNRRFQLLWAGSCASLLGVRTAETAYPLLLLAMTGSPLLAGSFGAVQIGVSVVCGLHGGVVADRHDRRQLILAADAVRFLATMSVVVALALHRFTIVHALLVAAVIGAATSYGGPARMIAVRSVVPPAQLRQALTQEEARGTGAALLGPPLAGLLFGIGRMLPILGTAIGSLLSFAATYAVRFDSRPQPAADPAADGGIWQGVRVLAGSGLLRATLGVAFALNLVGAALILPVIMLLRAQGSSSGSIGLALAGEAAGAIVGAFLVSRLHRLAGPGRLLLVSGWLCVPLLLAPTLPGGVPVVFLALAAMNLAMPSVRVMIDVLIFQQVPDELRGRVIAATMTVIMLGIPAGMLSSGLLLDQVAPGTALTVLAGLLALGLLPTTTGRALRSAGWPS